MQLQYCIYSSLAFLCAVWQLHLARGIYEDQLGEFDWKRENIGLIEHSLFLPKMQQFLGGSIIVATNAGALASLAGSSGHLEKQLLWRVLLGRSTRIVKIASIREAEQVVTLTEEAVSESTIVSVRGWSVRDGALVWECSLPVLENDTSSSYSVEPQMMYDSRRRVLTILYSNSLHILRALGVDSPEETLWSWSADDSDVHLKLTALVAPTTFTQQKAQERNPNDSNVRTAVGCVVTEGGVCAGEVVVIKVTTVTSNAHKVELDRFPSFLATDIALIHHADLHAIVSSSEEYGYLSDDIVFAIDTSGKQLVLGSLADGRTSSISLKSYTDMENFSAEVFVFADGSNGEIRPGLVVCWGAHRGDVADGGCNYYVAQQYQKGSSFEWSLLALNDGSANCENGTSFNVPLRSGLNTFGDVATSVHCISLTAQANIVEGLSIRSSAQKSKETGKNLHALDLNSLQWPLISPYIIARAGNQKRERTESPLHFAAVNRVSDELGDQYEILLVFQSGLTVLTRGNDRDGLAIAWWRNEALASAQQALLLDPPVAASGHSVDSDDHSVALSLQKRLHLQLTKLQTYAAVATEYMNHFLRSYGMHVSLPAFYSSETLGAGNLVEATFDGQTRRRLQKLRVFGFDKVAVFLCYSSKLSEQIEQQTQRAGNSSGVSFREAGLQVVALDLLRAHYPVSALATPHQDGAIKWTVQLLLQSADGLNPDGRCGKDAFSKYITFVKLLPNPAQFRRQSRGGVSSGLSGGGRVHRAESVTILVGMEDGCTFSWDLSLNLPTQDSSDADGSGEYKLQLSAVGMYTAPYTSFVDEGDVVGVTAGLTIPTTEAPPTELPIASYQLMHSRNGTELQSEIIIRQLVSKPYSSGTPTAPILNAADSTSSSNYVHHSAPLTGNFHIFKKSKSCDRARHIYSASDEVHDLCVHAELSAFAQFNSVDERVVAIAYPDISDAVHSRFSILGDDSVLLKYLNPFLVVVATLSASNDSDSLGGGEHERSQSVLFLTLLDSISGKVIARIAHDSATTPVHCLIVENHIIATYWNYKAKRTELSSVALYEGVIDSYEFSPVSSSRSGGLSAIMSATFASSSSSPPSRSAFSAITPMAVQKTFLLPHAVTALSHTETASGIANKNILLGLRNGQVYSLDFRQLHPRRPMTEPSKAEKEEGLQRYSPFLTLSPISAVTHNYTLAGGVAHIVSAPSKLESSCLVLSFGGGAVDIHLNRVIPSHGFDLLASDFNHMLLIAILLGLATCVFILRRMDYNKKLSTVWA